MNLSLSQIMAFSNEAAKRQLKRRAESILDATIAAHGEAKARNEYIDKLEKLSGR